MKIKLTLISFLFFGFYSKAQIVFWTETFNNGCLSGCLATGVNTGNGAWAIDNTGGCNDTYSNKWFISCAENGNAVAACGTGCGSNATLHIGADDGFFYDIGASYDAGGFGGCGFGGTYTYTRAVSPLISTVGYTGIIVSFNYIEFGNNAVDDGWVEYSTDGGVTWSLLINTVKTTCCGGVCNGFRQGRWANYASAVLPAAADNNPNFRVRFVWQNNDDGIGKDPSFAINDLTIGYSFLLPIELLDFSASSSEKIVRLKWATASETNNDHFIVQRSADGMLFDEVCRVNAAGNSSQTIYYSASDPFPLTGISYYRLVQQDFDGKISYSNIIALTFFDPEDFNLEGPFVSEEDHTLNVSLTDHSLNAISIQIADIPGRIVYEYHSAPGTEKTDLSIDISKFGKGIYFFTACNGKKTRTRKIFL